MGAKGMYSTLQGSVSLVFHLMATAAAAAAVIIVYNQTLFTFCFPLNIEPFYYCYYSLRADGK